MVTLREPGELRNRILAVWTGLWPAGLDTADDTPVAYTDLPSLGVNVFLEQIVEEEKLRRTFEMLRAANIAWIRQEFPWFDIEQPAKGQYWDVKNGKVTWEKYDRIVRLANEYGIALLARLDAPPNWSRQDNRHYTAPPDNLDDFGDFVATVVKRYQGQVRYYQIWNEPNLAFEWGNRPVKASEYTQLLQVAYRRAKAVDPGVVIVAAPLAPTIDAGPLNRSDVLFLEEMYRDGAGGYFDALSTMAYGLRSGPDDRRTDPGKDVNFSRPLLLRAIMVQHGDAGKPIWISELGWNALPPDFPLDGQEPMYGRVTLAQQARHTVRGLERIASEWPWAGPVFLWFFQRPSEGEKNQQFYYFRLVEPDFTPLPVYEAVKAYGLQPPVLPPGYHNESDYALSYRGDWREESDRGASLGRKRVGRAGATLRFQFQGGDLIWQTERGLGAGRVEVLIDGRKQAGPALSGAEAAAPAGVSLAARLPDGQHQVELTVVAGEVVVDGFIVRRQGATDWTLLVLGQLLLAGGLMLRRAGGRRGAFRGGFSH